MSPRWRTRVIGVAHDPLAGTPARSAQARNPLGVLEGLARDQLAPVGHRDLPGTAAGAIDAHCDLAHRRASPRLRLRLSSHRCPPHSMWIDPSPAPDATRSRPIACVRPGAHGACARSHIRRAAVVRAHRGRLDTALRLLGPPLDALDAHGPFMRARVFDSPDWIGHGVAPGFGRVRLVVVRSACRLAAPRPRDTARPPEGVRGTS